MSRYTWNRKGGYQCSTKGDRRFSAFYARLADGRSIEEHYQCDVFNQFDIGGTNWRLGKGKSPLRNISPDDLYLEYKDLWKQYFALNPYLVDFLIDILPNYNYTLSDVFATSPINQARAIADILNDIEMQQDFL